MKILKKNFMSWEESSPNLKKTTLRNKKTFSFWSDKTNLFLVNLDSRLGSLKACNLNLVRQLKMKNQRSKSWWARTKFQWRTTMNQRWPVVILITRAWRNNWHRKILILEVWSTSTMRLRENWVKCWRLKTSYQISRTSLSIWVLIKILLKIWLNSSWSPVLSDFILFCRVLCCYDQIIVYIY